MDYLFYGNITSTSTASTTSITLNIPCDADEILNLYALSSDVSHHLIYKQMPIERTTDGLSAVFDVQDNQLFLFIVSGQSNESDIPFEATYAVYNGEVISLPENNVLQLKGSTYIFPDNERKILK